MNDLYDNVAQSHRLCAAGTIFQEAMIHSQLEAADFYDDCNVNSSNISETVKYRVMMSRGVTYKEALYHHLEARQPSSMFMKKGIPAMQKIHKQQKSGISPSQVKKDLLNYQN